MSFKPSLNKILCFFMYGTVGLSSILLVNNGLKMIEFGSLEKCFFHDFTSLYRQHAVYYSVIVLFASIILVEKWKKENTIINLFFLSILGVTLFFAASKIVIVLFGLFLLYYVFFKQQNKFMKYALMSIFVLGLFFIGSSDKLSERFVDGLLISKTDFELDSRRFTYDEKKNISDIELRFLLGKIGFEHMVKDRKLIFGYGLGDQQDWFDYHLMRYNLAPNWYQGHNVHNQYLDIWLNIGIIGLIYFLFFLFYFLKIALKSRNEIWLIFLLVFTIIFLFEVYLSRNKGIILFTLWNMLFYANYISNRITGLNKPTNIMK